MRPRRCERMGLALLTMWALLCACVPHAGAQDFEALKAGVVKIHSTQDEARRTGSGFVVKLDRDDIYVVTASHVIEGDAQPQVYFHAHRNAPLNARVLKLEGGDPRGIALLLVHGGADLSKGVRALAWAKDDALAGGEELITIGFGLGQGEWAVVRVNVTALDGRDIRLEGRIEEGNSGGPLLRGGNVVGMITGVRQGFGVASPGYLVTGTLRGWRVDTQAGAASGTSSPQAVGGDAAPGEQQQSGDNSRRERLSGDDKSRREPVKDDDKSRREQAAGGVIAPPRPSAPADTTTATAQRVRLRAPAIRVGRITREEGQLKLRDAVLTVNLAGQPLYGSAQMEQRQVFEREVLTAAQGRITRERLRFREMRGSFTRVLGGEREVDDRTSPLHGISVLATRVGVGWSFAAEQGGLTESQQRELTGYVRDAADSYPDEPVAPGAQWEVRGDALQNFLQLGDFAVTDGRAVLRLTGVEPCGISSCARIAVDVQVAGIMIADDGSQSGLTLEGAGHLLRVVASDVNRELILTGRMTVASELTSAGVPVGISVVGPFEYHGTTQE